MHLQDHEPHELEGAIDYFFVTAILLSMGLVSTVLFGYVDPQELLAADGWLASLFLGQ